MNKKTLSLVGTVAGVLLVVMGFLMLVGAFGGHTSYYSTAPYDYDSGYATFGADYYTYSVNNAAEATDAAQAAASNARELVKITKVFFGLIMMAVGLFATCAFGIVFVGCNAPVAVVPKEEPEIPAEPIATEEVILPAEEETVAEAEPATQSIEEISE